MTSNLPTNNTNHDKPNDSRFWSTLQGWKESHGKYKVDKEAFLDLLRANNHVTLWEWQYVQSGLEDKKVTTLLKWLNQNHSEIKTWVPDILQANESFFVFPPYENLLQKLGLSRGDPVPLSVSQETTSTTNNKNTPKTTPSPLEPDEPQQQPAPKKPPSATRQIANRFSLATLVCTLCWLKRNDANASNTTTLTKQLLAANITQEDPSVAAAAPHLARFAIRDIDANRNVAQRLLLVEEAAGSGAENDEVSFEEALEREMADLLRLVFGPREAGPGGHPLSGVCRDGDDDGDGSHDGGVGLGVAPSVKSGVGQVVERNDARQANQDQEMSDAPPVADDGEIQRHAGSAGTGLPAPNLEETAAIELVTTQGTDNRSYPPSEVSEDDRDPSESIRTSHPRRRRRYSLPIMESSV